MTSFRVEKTFEGKVTNYPSGHDKTLKPKKSFNIFCQDYYDGRIIDDVFRELGTLIVGGRENRGN